MDTHIIYTKGEVAGKGMYEHGQGYVYCNRHRDLGAYSKIIIFKSKSGYEYETEHTKRRAPNTDIQPGRKERIHTRHKHKQDA